MGDSAVTFTVISILLLQLCGSGGVEEIQTATRTPGEINVTIVVMELSPVLSADIQGCRPGCDVINGQICVNGNCTCQQGLIDVNGTCLEAAWYHQNCTADAQCLDQHQHCSGDEHQCECNLDFEATVDKDSWRLDPAHVCRRKSGGLLGERCKSVSYCNYQIEHVTCYHNICRCQEFYTGFTGGKTCMNDAVGWDIAMKTAGISVMVLAIGFFIAFALKACSRSRLRNQMRWLRRSSDVSFRSDDFYCGRGGEESLDRPPRYTEEDVHKPPSYEEVFPEAAGGVENVCFSPDEPAPGYSVCDGVPAPGPALPPVHAPAPPAGAAEPIRRHRRGLSGPAAISLGPDDSCAIYTEPQRCLPVSGVTKATGPDGSTNRTEPQRHHPVSVVTNVAAPDSDASTGKAENHLQTSGAPREEKTTDTGNHRFNQADGRNGQEQEVWEDVEL